MEGTASTQGNVDPVTDGIAASDGTPQINLTPGLAASGAGIDAFGSGLSLSSVPTWVWLALGGIVVLKVARVF